MPPILREQETIGQFTVERLIGEGAFAQVYRVKHRVLGRQAMKVFKQPLEKDSSVGTLLSEAVLLSRMGHPNIVRVFDAGTFDSNGETYGYFTMEYVGGGTLHDVWRAQGELLMEATRAVDLVMQAANGLSIAHRSDPPIIHRDIKPTNILVAITANGYEAKVSDFGLARQVNPLTLMATAAGTLPFKAPEVFTSAKADSAAADVWSLGVTLYVLLTDRMPYELPVDMPPSLRHFRDAPMPPSQINVGANRKLDRIVMQALALDPALRFPNAGILREKLGDWQMEPVGPVDKSTRNASSHQSLKSIWPPVAPAERQKANDLVQFALRHALEGSFVVAAECMEDALVADPSLRAAYESRIRLWRMGVAM